MTNVLLAIPLLVAATCCQAQPSGNGNLLLQTGLQYQRLNPFASGHPFAFTDSCQSSTVFLYRQAYSHCCVWYDVEQDYVVLQTDQQQQLALVPNAIDSFTCGSALYLAARYLPAGTGWNKRYVQVLFRDANRLMVAVQYKHLLQSKNLDDIRPFYAETTRFAAWDNLSQTWMVLHRPGQWRNLLGPAAPAAENWLKQQGTNWRNLSPALAQQLFETFAHAQ